ncbi:unnamed protein product [Calicophoron daubneyi]|uniref:Tubulin delta chain n=1 Tax=Calicophoron daubneyi TaxID=300641 RepID=A0AAV2TB91_CALDB
MSVVSIQIGQCGNQLGAEFLNTVYSDCFDHMNSSTPIERDYIADSLSTFFVEKSRGALEARCVQIDMEEKVITRLRRSAKRLSKWTYPPGNSFTAKCGSGNNWAYGFFAHARHIKEHVEAPIQRQLEACDCLDGLLVTMSLAGGTGSGVGTKVLLELPDIVPKAPILTQLVWPYCRGEVSVQAYNAVLTLGHLLSSSTASSLDGFLMHHNDMLHNICSDRLRASNPNCQIGMDQLNMLASHQLAGVLQPYEETGNSGLFSCRRRLSSLLLNLCGHPDYRLLRLRCLPYLGDESRPFATETWAQLARHARQMLLTGSLSEDKLDWSVKSSGVDAVSQLHRTRVPLLSSFAVLRGQGAEEHVRHPDAFAHDLTKGLFSKAGSPVSYQYSSVRGHAHPFVGYPRGLFVVSNGGGARIDDQATAKDVTEEAATCGDTVASLTHVASRAWEMFVSKAYLHQYERYGLTTDLLMDCFANVQQIAHCYTSLT